LALNLKVNIHPRKRNGIVALEVASFPIEILRRASVPLYQLPLYLCSGKSAGVTHGITTIKYLELDSCRRIFERMRREMDLIWDSFFERRPG